TGIPCQVEVASEFRYRKVAVQPDTLFVTISQSGETADTLAALRNAKGAGYLASLTICNVATSSLVRESDLCLLTNAGPEIGVASTKAFTTQLVGLLLLTLALGRSQQRLAPDLEAELVGELRRLPSRLGEVLGMEKAVEKVAELFAEKHHTLFLGRGVQYPVAMEGALKLKEISYIHAEAYPAGELKHGPLALVDSDMPVVTVAPGDELLEKLKSNLQEVRARGGQLIVFADEQAGMEQEDGVQVIPMPQVREVLAPIYYTLPLQLLSYYVAVLRGTDVDQPRNLAKSVTVEKAGDATRTVARRQAGRRPFETSPACGDPPPPAPPQPCFCGEGGVDSPAAAHGGSCFIRMLVSALLTAFSVRDPLSLRRFAYFGGSVGPQSKEEFRIAISTPVVRRVFPRIAMPGHPWRPAGRGIRTALVTALPSPHPQGDGSSAHRRRPEALRAQGRQPSPQPAVAEVKETLNEFPWTFHSGRAVRHGRHHVRHRAFALSDVEAGLPRVVRRSHR